MNNIAVSIIIPVYNAERFMIKGLESCVNQTMQNIEVICINDASTDNSALIIEEYVKKYPDKIIYLDCEESRGSGGARNKGILHARGEYLCFMDSDDYLDIHLCEDVYKKAKEENADMVFYDYVRVEEQKEYRVQWIKEEELGAWYQQIWCAPWQQIVRRKIILDNNLFLPEKARADDDAVVPLWRYFAKKRCKMQKPYYYYVNREDSLVNEIKLSSVMSPIINIIPYRYNMMKQKGILDMHKAESDWMIARDVSVTLKRLMKLKAYFTTDIILEMHRRIDFLKEEQLDKGIMKYYMPCLDIEMVDDFLHSPDTFVEKYGDYEQYMNRQSQKGMCKSIEKDIKDILCKMKECYGENMAIWGTGKAGLPIISTLYRMGYHMPLYDNVKHGRLALAESVEWVRSFENLCDDHTQVVLVTSDIYFNEIEKQINSRYPDIKVVNFRRMIRSKCVK